MRGAGTILRRKSVKLLTTYVAKINDMAEIRWHTGPPRIPWACDFGVTIDTEEMDLILREVQTCVDGSRVFQAVPVRRYHFHIRCGDRVLFDATGRFLPGLTEAAREAERIARTLIHRDESILAKLDEWRLDVREPDDVLLFTLPFSDVQFGQFDEDIMAPEELPNSEALWR